MSFIVFVKEGVCYEKIMSGIAIIIVAFGLFASCEEDPTKIDPTKPDPTKPDQSYTVKFEANGGIRFLIHKP
jgi:hypothetical protein